MPDELRTLRSTSWDGPAPAVGDVLDDGRLWLVLSVVAGPGLGQWRLEVRALGRVIRWRNA